MSKIVFLTVTAMLILMPAQKSAASGRLRHP
jgi:hypothetical protein